MSETTHTLYLLMDDKGACMPTLYPTRDAAQRAADTSANKWTPVPTQVPAAPLAAERAEVREAVVRVFDAANISARPLTLNDLAAALGLKDYSHNGLADALIAAVRAECAAKVDALEEFIALECDPTQFIGAKREWLIGLHRKHFPQNYTPEAQP